MMQEPVETPTKPFYERYPRPSRWRRRGKTQDVLGAATPTNEGAAEAAVSVASSTTIEPASPLQSVYSQNPGDSEVVRGSPQLRLSFKDIVENDMIKRSSNRGAIVAPSRSRPISAEQLNPNESPDIGFGDWGADGGTTVLNTEPHNRRKRVAAPIVAKPQEGQWGGDGTTVENTQPSRKRKTKDSPQALPVTPVLTKPKKERVGYGFSFSDSMFIDSDEYPDTDGEKEPEADKKKTKVDSTSDGTVELALNSSFTDVVVLRDVGSFNVAKPPKTAICTHATEEDSMIFKASAKCLHKFTESGEIQEKLLRRVERMVLAKDKIRITTAQSLATVTECCVELRNFLMRIKEERIQTGEMREHVEHEVEWAVWLVDASRAGVLHVKSSDCACRPGWVG